MGEGSAGEFVDHELGRLQMHVAVDEAGKEDEPGRVERLLPLVARSDGGHVLTRHGDIGVEEFAREHREDASTLDDQVRRLVASGHGQAVGQIGLEGTAGRSRHVGVGVYLATLRAAVG